MKIEEVVALLTEKFGTLENFGKFLDFLIVRGQLVQLEAQRDSLRDEQAKTSQATEAQIQVVEVLIAEAEAAVKAGAK